MALLKTIWVFSVLGLTLLFLLPPSVVLLLLYFLRIKKFTGWAVGKIVKYWARFLVRLVGCEVTVEGVENIPCTGGVCFVSNHGSIFDIVLLLAYSKRLIGFIAKKELMLAPFLNIWILLIGGHFIDRKNIRKSVGTINTGIRQIKAGSAMIIFPEGHRSKGGLLPFHSGSFKLATQAAAPILPVAITGSHGIFEQYHRVCTVPVRVVFGKPINTADLLPEERRQALADRVRGVIAGALNP
ncbi:1-acyl-sn-glycerol-3-phosphate acyltransferase [Spirochaetia bacterium]|nr:1-acyl-sn-glycerol-3-phosphate acyltransferase [Spirochaetia bacterium]